LEVPELSANKAYRDHQNIPARARLRGLAANPAVPADLLRRLVDRYFTDVEYPVMNRKSWTDEQVDVLIDHPDVRVRRRLAQAQHLPSNHRARLVEDADEHLLETLASGLSVYRWWSDEPAPSMPAWAFERLLARRPQYVDRIARNVWAPRSVRDQLPAPPPMPWEVPMTLAEAEASVDGASWARARAAGHSDLTAERVARLSTDPDRLVRVAVSMRPGLSDKQRAAIDHEVRPGDRLVPAEWARTTRDPDVQRACATSVHIGLRRSVAMNRNLAPDLVTVLTTDDDFAVRLLLCENQESVPADLVLMTYLEARTLSRDLLLTHPGLRRDRLGHLADSPNARLRGLAVLDPRVPAAVIERLGNDPEPVVRGWVAPDGRLSTGRALALFEEPELTGRAAANPRLPVEVLERVLHDAEAELTDESPPTQHLFLGKGATE
jgi:hypothetical protein